MSGVKLPPVIFRPFQGVIRRGSGVSIRGVKIVRVMTFLSCVEFVITHDGSGTGTNGIYPD